MDTFKLRANAKESVCGGRDTDDGIMFESVIRVREWPSMDDE